MAQKSAAINAINLQYEDLASEVTRRRITMTRSGDITEKNSEAREMHSSSEQALLPHWAQLTEPPAPPPSPAEESVSP
ncbi:myocilin opposite strand protein [Nycticebus coucang]|uniref:myocilin opposite strand protein n=1 Tax=Nycticebus coucang TaxID=9470 RepID=UPI00234D8649|nr:myocilin opposite strand protein [Nycticebus coucang]